MKRTIWQKICQVCPLCRYTRITKVKGLKYYLFKKIESICTICLMAKSPSFEKKGNAVNLYFEKRGPALRIPPVQRKSITPPISQKRKITERMPKVMEYYERVLSTNERLEELKRIRLKGDKRIVGTFCNFVPEELLYAGGCIPIRLCSGYYETIAFAEEVLPRDICPLIKSSFGFKLIENSFFSLCDLVIVPTTCDGKKKMAEILNDYVPTYVLELPQRKNLKSVNLWLKEIKNLKLKLEKFFGTKITLKNLKEAVLLLQKRNHMFRQIYELRKINPLIISLRDMAIITQACFYDDINRWIETTQMLYAQLKQQISSLRTDKRNSGLLLTGAPIIWPNFKLFDIFENVGANVVIDDLCSGTQHLYNPVEIDEWNEEGILKAISIKYLLPSICPCFTESNDRIDRILNLVNEFDIKGVIYHALRLCQLYDIEIYRVRQALKDNGVPLLVIHTDYSQEDVEQIKTRVEAFLEMLKEK